jgi:hypothetical protein
MKNIVTADKLKELAALPNITEFDSGFRLCTTCDFCIYHKRYMEDARPVTVDICTLFKARIYDTDGSCSEWQSI